MIPVRMQPEPVGFDKDVRQEGHQWLKQKKLLSASMLPKGAELPTYWRKYNKQLYDAYNGVCSYLAFYFEFVSGASTTDHFIAKSRDAFNAYEWSNYRLACLGANQRKNRYDDVLNAFRFKHVEKLVEQHFVEMSGLHLFGTVFINLPKSFLHRKWSDKE